MRNTIAILEDEIDRVQVMLPLLKELFPHLETVLFSKAPEINAWLEENLECCVLICLDHDLGADIIEEDKRIDPGDGRDVTNFLSNKTPVCPVLIHTTNTYARPTMIESLEENNWEVDYVAPYEDVLWIHQSWKKRVCELLSTEADNHAV
ncbi:MAG: hypothetical protein COA78_02960 [Blastopirellula sp.]|nr:MAG: hypothetical protein COA78_02960 [Blastopirellula sp.]